MTSKEALKELLYYATLDDSGFTPYTKEYAEVIARDLNKLSQLEDIEKELGIDLITLFKGLRETGIWVKRDNEIIHIEPLYIKVEMDCVRPLIGSITLKELYFEDLDYIMDTTGYEWYVEDYGKTWALTKEELENDKR